jgi:hypothetical protein
MSNKTKSSVEPTTGSATQATTSSSTLMSVPVTVQQDKKGNGTSYLVWPKKDLEGKASIMAGKEGDKVVNKGDIVRDPVTGQDVYLIRIHRGKRVWYGKGLIEVPVSDQPETQE